MPPSMNTVTYTCVCVHPTLVGFYRQYVWDILESTVQKTNSAYHTASKELAETKEKLTKVGWRYTMYVPM